jgi:hypothetical protein
MGVVSEWMETAREHHDQLAFSVKGRGSSVDIATRLLAGQPRNQGVISGRGNRYYFIQSIQTGSEAHGASCAVDIGGSFQGVKTAEA